MLGLQQGQGKPTSKLLKTRGSELEQFKPCVLEHDLLSETIVAISNNRREAALFNQFTLERKATLHPPPFSGNFCLHDIAVCMHTRRVYLLNSVSCALLAYSHDGYYLAQLNLEMRFKCGQQWRKDQGKENGGTPTESISDMTEESYLVDVPLLCKAGPLGHLYVAGEGNHSCVQEYSMHGALLRTILVPKDMQERPLLHPMTLRMVTKLLVLRGKDADTLAISVDHSALFYLYNLKTGAWTQRPLHQRYPRASLIKANEALDEFFVKEPASRQILRTNFANTYTQVWEMEDSGVSRREFWYLHDIVAIPASCEDQGLEPQVQVPLSPTVLAVVTKDSPDDPPQLLTMEPTRAEVHGDAFSIVQQGEQASRDGEGV